MIEASNFGPERRPGVDARGVDARDRRRKARRNALILGIVAFAFYASFIAMSVMRARP